MRRYELPLSATAAAVTVTIALVGGCTGPVDIFVAPEEMGETTGPDGVTETSHEATSTTDGEDPTPGLDLSVHITDPLPGEPLPQRPSNGGSARFDYPVRLAVTNKGLDFSGGVDLAYEIDGEPVEAEQIVAASLAPDEVLDHTVELDLSNFELGLHELCAELGLVGDEDSSNDRSCVRYELELARFDYAAIDAWVTMPEDIESTHEIPLGTKIQQVTFMFENRGSTPIHSGFPSPVMLRLGSVQTDTAWLAGVGPVASGETVTAVFDESEVPDTPTDSFSICVSMTLPSDPSPHNDTFCTETYEVVP